MDIRPEYKAFAPTPEAVAYLKRTIHEKTPYELATIHIANKIRISHLAFRLYVTLLSYAGRCNRYQAWPDNEQLQKELECKKSALHDAFAELEDAKLIVSTRRWNTSSLREINIPAEIADQIEA
jgi:hypothetical protein